MANAASGALGPLSILNGTMSEWQARAEKNPIVDFVDYCLRGVGQVCFMNNPVTGAFILAAMFVAPIRGDRIWLGVAGVIGVAVSTLTAHALGLDRGAIRAGLFGFNGVLVGAGLALFLGPNWDGLVFVWIIAVSALSTVLMAALATIFLTAWKVPPFTLAFNIATLLFLVTALHAANGRFAGVLQPNAPAITAEDVSTDFRTISGDNTIVDGITATFNGIGQLFFAEDVIAGILIVIGLMVCSRIAGLFALLGSILGMLTGLALGADGGAIYHGLWGFNSFDAALAIGGVFYVLTWRSGLLAAACAIFTALLFGAISSIFEPWGLPALTLPFCFGTLAFVLLKGAARNFVPVEVQDITTPEEHLQRMRGERRGVGRDAVGALRED